MKKSIILLFLICWSFIAKSQVFDGNLYVYTQQDLNTFNYTEVTGSLVFYGGNNDDPIIDLSALSQLEKVERIQVSNWGLQDTQSFNIPSLVESGTITISFNENPIAITLPQLLSLNSLVIEGSEGIINIDLPKLNSLDNLAIGQSLMPNKVSINDIGNVEKLLYLSLYIDQSSNFILTGLKNLITIDDFVISGNKSPEELPFDISFLSGIESIKNISVGDYFGNFLSNQIAIPIVQRLSISNTNSENLEWLPLIGNVVSLEVMGNSNLISLNGINKLHKIRSVHIEANSKLTECCLSLPLDENSLSTFMFMNNASGCNSLEEVQSNPSCHHLEITNITGYPGARHNYHRWEITNLTNEEQTYEYIEKDTDGNDISSSIIIPANGTVFLETLVGELDNGGVIVTGTPMGYEASAIDVGFEFSAEEIVTSNTRNWLVKNLNTYPVWFFESNTNDWHLVEAETAYSLELDLGVKTSTISYGNNKSITINAAPAIFDGNYYIYNQEDADRFYFYEITGDLVIIPEEGETLSSLDKLKKLQKGPSTTISNCNNHLLFNDAFDHIVEFNYLTMYDNHFTTFPSFSSLRAVHTSLEISVGSNMTNINNIFPSLETVGNGIVFQGRVNSEDSDRVPIDIQGFSKLEYVGNISFPRYGIRKISGFNVLKEFTSQSHLAVGYTNDLETIEGFESLVSVSGIIISANKRLNEIIGFNSIQNLGDFAVYSNEMLENIDAFEQLSEVDGFTISSNNFKIFPRFESLIKVNKVFNITFGSSVELVDNIFPNLESVEGSLNLSVVPSESLPIDIYGFNKLVSISSFYLSGNGIRKISGFNALEVVHPYERDGVITSYLNISSKEDLEELDGFNSLVYLQGLVLTGNRSLKKVSGFNAVEKIYSQFSIGSNTLLEGFNALGSLKEISNLYFTDNSNVLDFDLPSLEVVENSLHISGNHQMIELSGFENLRSVGGALNIINNDRLEVISGFGSSSSSFITNSQYNRIVCSSLKSLHTITGFNNIQTSNSIYIGHNGTNENLNQGEFNAFNNLETLNGELVIDGSGFNRISGVENLKAIGGSVVIVNNSTEYISGFNSLPSSNIQISGNNSLKEISGFTSLIGGSISISNHPELISIPAFESLIELSQLNIQDNNVLHSLPQFQRLERLGSISVTGNPELKTCCYTFPNLIAAPTTASIENNASNCNVLESFINPCVYVGDYTIASQSDADLFNYAEVTGSLIIDGTSLSSLDLSNLFFLEKIANELEIKNINFDLDLSPLEESLIYVSNIIIKDNTQLGALDFFSNLTTLYTIEIRNNSLSTDLTIPKNNHITSLTSISVTDGNVGNIVLEGFPYLTHIDAIAFGEAFNNRNSTIEWYETSNLTEVSDLAISSSEDHEIDLSFLANVNEINVLTIHKWKASTYEFKGLEGVRILGANLGLTNAPETILETYSLELLDFSSLQSLNISGSTLLTDLEFLPRNTKVLSTLTITGNTGLSDCCVVTDIVIPSTEVSISDNAVSCNSYENIKANCGYPYRIVDAGCVPGVCSI